MVTSRHHRHHRLLLLPNVPRPQDLDVSISHIGVCAERKLRYAIIAALKTSMASGRRQPTRVIGSARLIEVASVTVLQ